MPFCSVIPVNLIGSSTNQEISQFDFQQTPERFQKNALNQKTNTPRKTNMLPKKKPFKKEN